jgi:hypothetical protein
MLPLFACAGVAIALRQLRIVSLEFCAYPPNFALSIDSCLTELGHNLPNVPAAYIPYFQYWTAG